MTTLVKLRRGSAWSGHTAGSLTTLGWVLSRGAVWTCCFQELRLLVFSLLAVSPTWRPQRDTGCGVYRTPVKDKARTR